MGGEKGKGKECGPRQRRGIASWSRFGRCAVYNTISLQWLAPVDRTTSGRAGQHDVGRRDWRELDQLA